MVISSLREQELSSFGTHEEGPRSVRFSVGPEQIARKGEIHSGLISAEFDTGVFNFYLPCEYRTRDPGEYTASAYARGEREIDIKDGRSTEARSNKAIYNGKTG